MEKKITVIGCILWIAGLAATIIGLNLDGGAGNWVTITGNAVFLIGLGITGAVWFRKRQEEKKE